MTRCTTRVVIIDVFPTLAFAVKCISLAVVAILELLDCIEVEVEAQVG